MHTVTVNGKQYRSIREACHDLKISYQKVKRLCRHYQKAYVDPTVAVEWCLGSRPLVPSAEQKTFKYEQDKESGLLRQISYKARCHDIILSVF